MADAPAYTTVPGKISDLLAKIRKAGVPDSVTNEWLRSLGFKSSNDRSLVGVLKQIGFVGANGTPTPAWRQYRGKDHQAVLGRAIREGYADLYSLYDDAHERDAEDLGHWFSTKTDAGQQVISKSVATFKNLASEAVFGDRSATSPKEQGASAGAGRKSASTPGMSSGGDPDPAKRHGGDVTVNINIQLSLPDSADDNFFEAFFRSMKKNLLDGPTE